jgi:hypothetical protein
MTLHAVPMALELSRSPLDGSARLTSTFETISKCLTEKETE